MENTDTNLSPSVHTNPLIKKTEQLIEAKNSDDKSFQEKLIAEIDELLKLRINNEKRILALIDEGLIRDDGIVSDIALNMHKSSKDSITELIKVKMNLEGVATENKSVVHRFDVNGLITALRAAREQKSTIPSRVTGEAF